VIYRWVNKFRTHGTVHNLNRKDTNRQSHSGRPISSRKPHNVAAVRDSVVNMQSFQHLCNLAERYVQVLGKFWTALGRRRGVVRVLQWFQHDGATPHSSNESLAWLQQRFPWPTDQPQVWPAVVAAFTGLEPTYFYLWGTLRPGCMATTPRLSLTWRQQSQQQ